MLLTLCFKKYPLIFLLICVFLKGTGLGMAQNSGDSLALFSETLNETRILQAHLPKDYAVSEKNYPVLVALDGEYIFDYAKGITSFLSNDFGFLPEVIVISILNTDRNRDLFVDLSPNGTYLKFIAFLEKELIPFIKENYKTNGFQMLYGWSSGAGIANYVAVKKPKLFNGYILAGSGIGPKTEAFIRDEISAASYSKTFLFASAEGTTARAGGLKKHRALLEQINPKGLRHEFKIYKESNHIEAMSKGLEDGLKFIFRDYYIPDSIVTKGSAKIINYYDSLKEMYGFKTRIPRGAINETSGILVHQNQAEEALKLLNYGIALYPESDLLLATKAEIHVHLGQKNKAMKYYQLALKKARFPAAKLKYKSILKKLKRSSKN